MLRCDAFSKPLSKDDIEKLAAEASRAHRRAIEFYRLELGGDQYAADLAALKLSPAELAVTQLNYGISLFKLKRVTEARATWSAISRSAAVEILAKVWIDLADNN